MARRSIVLSVMAVAVFLGFGVAAGRADAAGGVAADPDVAGMDHSKLNHGVLGPEPAARAAQKAGATSGAVDADVVGMDHSRLNHGVLGAEPRRCMEGHAHAASAAVAPAGVAKDHEESDHGALSGAAPQQRHADHAHAKSDEQPKSGPASTGADERLNSALRLIGRALDSAQIGDADGVARHAEEAMRQVVLSEKAGPSEHKRQGIEHLLAALEDGRKNNLDGARKHAHEALVHLNEARK